MRLEEAKQILEENGFLITELNREEYDFNTEYDKKRDELIRQKIRDDGRYRRLDRRGDKETNKIYNLYHNKNADVRVPGKRPGTTRSTKGTERSREITRRLDAKRDEYRQLRKKLVSIISPGIEYELDKLNMTYKEYCEQCSDWCIICYFSCPGSSNTPYIVQKGYKTKEEADADCEKFKAWAHTEVEYTDVETMVYLVYPTEIMENEGASYKEKKVPEGTPPKFVANPYYRTNYWGD